MARKVFAICVILVLAVAFALLVTMVPEKAEPLQLAEPEAVTSIEITKIDGTKVTAGERDEIDRIMKVIAGAEPTRIQSVNDTPDEPYGTLRIKTDTGTEEIHYYERDGEYFVEKPYAGVYRVEQDIL